MQNKISKIVLIVSMVFCVSTLVVLIFLYKFINSKNSTLEQSQIAWQTEELRREEIKSLDRTLETLREERASLESHFVRSSDVVPLLDTLEKLAVSVSAKAEISSVDIIKDTASLLVGIRASGSFSSLYKFLMLLENSPYELEFILVDFRKSLSNGSESGLQWEATFRAKILSFLP